MVLKIDESVLKHIQSLCYKKLLFEMIDQQTRSFAGEIARKYLEENGYTNVVSVKCDEENNSPDIVSLGRVKITIVERWFPWSESYNTHIIML